LTDLSGFSLFLEESHKFSSVLLRLPNKLTDEIIEFNKKLPGKHENNPHITILYGLNHNDPSEVLYILKKFEPFVVKLGKITKFENDLDIIKIDVSGEGLFDLNKALKKLPHTETYQDYKPHITLSYCQKNTKIPDSHHFLNKSFIAKNIYFSDKEENTTDFKLSHRKH
jgi:2'-5' RNA ligase